VTGEAREARAPVGDPHDARPRPGLRLATLRTAQESGTRDGPRHQEVAVTIDPPMNRTDPRRGLQQRHETRLPVRQNAL